jgi:hypothetical protein
MGSGESSPRKITIEKNDLDGNDSLVTNVSKESIAKQTVESDKKVSSDRWVTENDFNKLKSSYDGKIRAIEEQNAQLYQTTVDHFAKAVEKVEQKYLKVTEPPVCGELQTSVMNCYLNNRSKSLNCSAEVNAFNNCIHKYRERTLAH